MTLCDGDVKGAGCVVVQYRANLLSVLADS